MYARQKYNRQNFENLQRKINAVEAFAKELKAKENDPPSVIIGHRLMTLLQQS